MKIGFLGTGQMGKPMAHNLLKAKHALSVYARHPEKVSDLKSAGASFLASPAEVAGASEVLVLCLPTDAEVDAVIEGEAGILAGASRGALVLDTTTGTPAAAQRVAQVLKSKGLDYLDAPISGGVKGALDAKLTFMVGGEDKAIDRAVPLMEAMGTTIFRVGPIGTGRMVKALNQIITGMNVLILCESVVLAKKAGILPERVFEILSKCSANSFHLQNKLPQFIIPGKFDGGFRIDLMIKDLEIALQAAKEMRTPMMLTGMATQVYRAASASGYGAKDISGMANFLGSFVGIDFTAK
ncbi:MAG: beta-hydroxyacid dehydrogenase, 3-hydroxyisobutyrate dehydrogenase [Deltaproteobacteria bacterium]|nr:beta-hydroxyacid dehydrogenase, 3-hydroxyisobutyrate dehydrogenase [Deltaproteobacteria bacterium]